MMRKLFPLWLLLIVRQTVWADVLVGRGVSIADGDTLALLEAVEPSPDDDPGLVEPAFEAPSGSSSFATVRAS